MFKYTKHTLKKIELILEESGYIIRYEKGNFQSGYAIVQDRKIAIVNKFFDTEGRINCLLDILAVVEIPAEILSEKTAKFYKQVLKSTAEEGEEEEKTGEKEEE